jgi:hypothetical protein
MKNQPQHPERNLSMEEGVNVLIDNARQRVRQRYRKCG